MSANLIIGSSHALQFSAAIGDHSATHDGAQDSLIHITSRTGADNRLIYTAPKPRFMKFQKTDNNATKISFGSPIDEIRKYNTKKSKVFLMIGGSEPCAYFFQRHSKPFDFFHPDVPQTDPRRQILPLAVMKSILSLLLSNASLAMEALARQLPLARKYCVSAPPPIPSEDHIRKFPEIFDFKTQEIEEKSIRLKIYKLYMEYMIDFSRRNSIDFIDSSTLNIDEEGFLKEEYWDGCTHASPHYYKDIVESLKL
jgi:hypothetical protein